MSNSSRINDYLEGLMNEEERNSFLSAVEHNSELKKELHFKQELYATLKDQNLQVLREKIHDRNLSIKRIPFYISSGKRVLMMAAATISIIIISGVIYLMVNSKNISPEQLAEDYYLPANAIQQVRSVNQSDPYGTELAFDYYNHQRYNEALDVFLKVENQIISNFYAGICYFELGRYSSAKECFQYVVSDQQNLLIEQATWYLMLSELKTGNVEKAQTIILEIIEEKSPFAADAKEILRKLD